MRLVEIEKFWKSISRGTRFQVQFYAAAFVIGTLLFFGPHVFPSEIWKPVAEGLGIALVAASVLGFAQRLFFYDDFRTEVEGLIGEALKNYLQSNLLPFIGDGVERLYADRELAMRDFKKHVLLEKERVIIIGSSLKGLLDPTERDGHKKDFADVLRQKVEQKVPVEFLLTHPALAFLREDAEGRKEKAIKNEIIETLKYLIGPPYQSQGKPSIGVPLTNIRLYHGTPTLFCIICSEWMLMNPYTYQANAYEGFALEISKKSEAGLYSKIERSHFRKPWENRETTTVLTKDVMTSIETFTLEDIFPDRRDALVRQKPNNIISPEC
ncbi:MAG: hypothetical protein HY742_00060 [Deltaproteobacteria bacterium]|nr:hypothetical protein [Deltaproteobacteria bacterium]